MLLRELHDLCLIDPICFFNTIVTHDESDEHIFNNLFNNFHPIFLQLNWNWNSIKSKFHFNLCNLIELISFNLGI